MTGLAREVAVVGAGSSPITRNGGPAVERLAVAACKAALDDAGLTGADIDGVFEYQFGWDSPDAHYVQRALGIPDLAAYADIGPMGPSGLGGALASIMAVASGACETALVYRAITQSAGGTGSYRGGGAPIGAMGGTLPCTLPYGYFPIIPAIAMMMQRRMHELRGKIEDYGYIAINARKWSAMNACAVLREPITMEDYVTSRILAEPLRLLDCDYPVSGASAVVVTTGERARNLRKKPAYVDAIAQASGPRPDWVQAEDFMFGATRRCA
jgi:acetyl-CoA acetyltransferase